MDRFQVLAALSGTRKYKNEHIGHFPGSVRALPPVFLGLAVVTTLCALFRPDVVFPQEHFAPPSRRYIRGGLCPGGPGRAGVVAAVVSTSSLRLVGNMYSAVLHAKYEVGDTVRELGV